MSAFYAPVADGEAGAEVYALATTAPVSRPQPASRQQANYGPPSAYMPDGDYQLNPALNNKAEYRLYVTNNEGRAIRCTTSYSIVVNIYQTGNAIGRSSSELQKTLTDNATVVVPPGQRMQSSYVSGVVPYTGNSRTAWGWAS